MTPEGSDIGDLAISDGREAGRVRGEKGPEFRSFHLEPAAA